jgi:hypothetical protein
MRAGERERVYRERKEGAREGVERVRGRKGKREGES